MNGSYLKSKQHKEHEASESRATEKMEHRGMKAFGTDAAAEALEDRAHKGATKKKGKKCCPPHAEVNDVFGYR